MDENDSLRSIGLVNKQIQDTQAPSPQWSPPSRGEGAYPLKSSRVRQRGEIN